MLDLSLSVLNPDGGGVEHQANKPRLVYDANGTARWENLSIHTLEYQGNDDICPVVSMCTCGDMHACLGLDFAPIPADQDIPCFNWKKFKMAEALVSRSRLKLPTTFAIVARWGDDSGDEAESSEIPYHPQ